MARLERKREGQADEVRTVPFGRFENVELDGSTVSRARFEPGWRWSESVKPLAGTELCEFHHIGYCISGSARVVSRDGAELTVGPGDIFQVPPGHDAWVLGDEPWVTVDWGPSSTYGLAAGEGGERIVKTLLFTDIVGSTDAARRMGDGRWRDMLTRHDQIIRHELDRHRGREVTTTGDGVLALFDSAERAVIAAQAIARSMPTIGIEVRSGVHTGEVTMRPGNVGGLAVHIASRVMSLAGAGEVLVSWTTRDLLAGSSLRFVSRGLHELKGLDDPREIHAVVAGVPADGTVAG